MSTVPTRRSSVTPSGICTKGASRTSLDTGPLPSFSRSPACVHGVDQAQWAPEPPVISSSSSRHGPKHGKTNPRGIFAMVSSTMLVRCGFSHHSLRHLRPMHAWRIPVMLSLGCSLCAGASQLKRPDMAVNTRPYTVSTISAAALRPPGQAASMHAC